MAFGTFDIFHEGHKNFLRQAQKSPYTPLIKGSKGGIVLIVVVARDKTVLEVKGRRPRNSEKKRMAAIKKSGLADKVVLGRIKNKYALIKKYKPDVICLGYDQRYFISDLRKKIKEFGLATKIKRLKPYKPRIYKSSKLKY